MSLFAESVVDERNLYILAHKQKVKMREARNSALERGSSNAVRKNWHALDSYSTKEDLLAEG